MALHAAEFLFEDDMAHIHRGDYNLAFNTAIHLPLARRHVQLSGAIGTD